MNFKGCGKMNENKSNINWLITIYPRIGENSDKISDCEI